MQQSQVKAFKSTTERLYNDVRAEYARLCSVKSRNGTPVFDQDYILEQLADKFYKSSKTIENIVFNRVSPGRHAKAEGNVAA